MATAPTRDSIRAWTALDLAGLGYGTDAPGDAKLQVQLDRAVMYLGWVTSRQYADGQTDTFPLVKTAMDQAVQMRAEQVILGLAADQLETVGDVDLIATFSAGPYSETRKDTEARKQSLNPWPMLDDLLWLLLGLFPGETNDRVLERYGYWLYLLRGINVPAWQVVETDWGRGMGASDFWFGHNFLGAPIGAWPDGRIG
jgi:hypothetical protein